MLQAIQSNLHRYFTKGHERSLKAKKNIVQSVVLKGGSVMISLILIPLTINYINPTQYGMWLTLSSLITWAALFDMGLGNGLKNKLAEFIALDNIEKARSYVSSAYIILTVISILLFICFYFINPHIQWFRILNVKDNSAAGLNQLVLIIFAFFCFQFVIQLINTVLTANQAPAKFAFLNLIAQALTLIGVLCLIRFHKQGSLTDLVFVIGGVPIMALLAGSIWFYKGSYKQIAPALKYVNLKHAKELLSVGGGFFLIQVSALMLYETDNIVITQLFGPKEVTTFNVAYKLFSVVLMLFLIVITPFWSAFTEAYVKDDYAWIKNAIDKIHKLWIVLSFGSVLVLIISPWLYNLWLGKSVSVPLSLSVAMCLFTITNIWQAIYVQLLNGVGKIKLQLYMVTAGAIINIPLSVVLGRSFGVAGVTFANVVIFIIIGIVFWIQAGKIINKTATGIFNA